MPARGTTSGTGLDLLLDPEERRGRRGLEAQLREAIQAGRLYGGTTLPSTRALARDLRVARGTVVEAYEQLVAEGYLEARRGSGTRVAEGPARNLVATPPATPGRRPLVDLTPGQPDLTSFPRQAWLAALRRGLRAASPGILGYGDARGDAALRASLARYLGRARGVDATAERIVVVHGFNQGLGLWARTLRGVGHRHVAIEEPTLPLLRQVLRHAGLTVHAVPVDEDGLQVDALEATPATAVVIAPAHQFPAGSVLHPARRVALLRWAARRGGHIAEDDYDGEFRYDRASVGALQGLDPERVLYAGTASKSLAPGVRLGWVVAPPALLAGLVQEREIADRQPAALDQVALNDLIESGGYDRHLRRMRQVYRRRRDRLVELVGKRTPQVRVTGAAAGLHAVLSLPPGEDESRVVRELARSSIAVGALGDYLESPGALPTLVVGYGTPPEHAIEAALQAFTRALAGALGPSKMPHDAGT
ncbi:MAG: PLP-dependent aminotransferase family protein [Candidatus Dormibacteraceae bacterium]